MDQGFISTLVQVKTLQIPPNFSACDYRLLDISSPCALACALSLGIGLTSRSRNVSLRW